MRIVFFGSGDFGCPSLASLKESEHTILEIVTQPARPAGRGRKIVPTAISRLANQLGLSVVESADVNQADFIAAIADLKPEVIVVIAFGQKIGSRLLNLPHCRAINLHGSLLPAYRGAAPINWAIINGEKCTGITVIELNEDWDAGDILGQISIDILPDETADELHDRLALLGPQLIGDVLDKIAAGVDQSLAQDHRRASRAPKLRKSDAEIDWNQSAEKICRQILGMWPWPGAHCLLRQAGGEKLYRLTIARAQVAPPCSTVGPAPADAAPGSLADDLTVICGQGRLRLLELRPENGKLLSFDDFVNGRHLQASDSLLNG